MVNEPPKEIPSEFLQSFTMNGLVKLESWYINESQSPAATKIYKKTEIDELTEKANRREMNYYGETDKFLYAALDHFPIKDKSCVVMGSQIPWYESICLSYGAREVTTIEYWKVESEHPQVRMLTPDEYAKNPQQFDAAFSISSFEHDGLGRYGDPVRPNADLEAMQRMKSIIKPGGLFYLAVPVAMDKVVWNAHRIYGRQRLPHLLAGWKILAAVGMHEQLLDLDTGKDGPYQPVFVLENTPT